MIHNYTTTELEHLLSDFYKHIDHECYTTELRCDLINGSLWVWFTAKPLESDECSHKPPIVTMKYKVRTINV